MLHATLHFRLEFRVISQKFFHLDRRCLIRVRVFQVIVLILLRVWISSVICRCESSRRTSGWLLRPWDSSPSRPESLRHSLILAVMALLRADQWPFSLILSLHHGYGRGCPAVLRLHGGHRGAELRIEVETVPVIALPRGKRDPWIACRGHYLRLHGQEGAHTIEVKVLWPWELHLLASTVEKTLESQNLWTMEIESLADLLKAFLSYG